MPGQVYVSSDPVCGFATEVRLGDQPPHLVVRSVAYDSGFRAVGLKAGDQVLELEGQTLTPPPGTRSGAWEPQLPGQYQESDRWRASHRTEGDAVELTIRRKAVGQGWEVKKLKAPLRFNRSFRNESNQPVDFENGPGPYQSDGFSVRWSSWFESLQDRISAVACFGPIRPGLTTRFEYKQLLEHQPRVDFLVKNYPGAFSSALAEDYACALEWLHGRLYSLTDADLAYRTEDEVRVRQIAVAAQADWQAALANPSADLVPTFPAEHPIHGQLKQVSGRCVVLSDLRTRQWISEAGHGYFSAGNDADGWYFLDMESMGAQRMLRAVRRYQRRVSARLEERYNLLVRILPDPRILVMNDIGHWGLQVELLAANVGDSLFVDVRGGEAAPLFAGEAGLMTAHGELPSPTASPAAVVEAMILAVKNDDLTLWKGLFADWMLRNNPDGSPQVCFLMQVPSEEDFGRSRTSFAGRLYDARVLWTDDPRLVTTGQEYPGAPRVEEVLVEVEHIGIVDGEYRSFMDVTVRRYWRLQRIDGGAWRIASLQPL